MKITYEIGKRQFIKTLGLASTGLYAACTSSVTTDIKMQTKAKMMPGIQLYTVREQMAIDSPATLKTLADIGYQDVELAGLPKGFSAEEMRTLFDGLGLRCPAIHLQGPIEEHGEIAKTVGADMIVQPVALELLDKNWQPKKDLNLDVFRRLAESLNQTGALAKQMGLQFGYHNHAWEMLRIDGQLAYEILLEETDPELVFMELDLGWTHVGQVDALDLFKRYPGRFKSCHIKDFDEHQTMVDPGQGVVTLGEQLSHYALAGFEHYFVEHDNSKAPLQTAKNGYDYLLGLDMFSL